MVLNKNLSPFFFLILLFVISACKSSGGSSSTPAPAPIPTITSGGTIQISGTLTYDFVSAATGKLDYSGIIQKPIRNVYVELLNAANDAVVSSTNTNDSGFYSFNIVSSASVKLRVYAEMKSPAVIIQDNTNGNAEYAIVTSAFSASGLTTKDIRAVSGWTGTNSSGSYSSTRMAAPFAILDSIYTITKKIYIARPAISFPLLKVNWSINNIAVAGDITIGQITTTHYKPSVNQLYILGKADIDTDEYDNHVIVHEWGHFLETNISRSDSRGGNHSAGDEKDISLAFGEGWGNALSGMAFDPDYLYSDTGGTRQQSGFQINLETSTNDTHKGWYSETSIQEILYDLYDSTNEAGDNLTLGIGPILDVLTNYQKTTTAATSLFSFIYGLETANPSYTANINTLLATKLIAPISDPYGSSETNNGGWSFNLPIYNSLILGSGNVAISLYGKSGANNYYGLLNTLFNNKYIKFTATSATTSLLVTTNDSFYLDVLKKGNSVGLYSQGRSSAAAFGPFTMNIPTTPGQEYIIQVFTDQSLVYNSSIVNLTISGSAL